MSKCEMCSSIKDYKECKRGEFTSNIFYDSNNGKFILVLEQFRFEYSEININYCPICGRKLKYDKIKKYSCEDMLRTYYGLPPYNDGMNICKFDSWFFMSIQKEYSMEEILKTKEELKKKYPEFIND